MLQATGCYKGKVSNPERLSRALSNLKTFRRDYPWRRPLDGLAGDLLTAFAKAADPASAPDDEDPPSVTSLEAGDLFRVLVLDECVPVVDANEAYKIACIIAEETSGK